MTGVVAEERSIISGPNDKVGRWAHPGIRAAGSRIPAFHRPLPLPLYFSGPLSLHATSAFLVRDVGAAGGDVVVGAAHDDGDGGRSTSQRGARWRE
jgi:hypothetical protein